MQLPNKSGICCDSCGVTYQSDFMYYSFDFHYISVHDNRRPQLNNIMNFSVVSSFDICTACFEVIKKTIISNYANTMSSKRGVGPPQFVVCEITGRKLVGTYDYYYCVVAKINVKMSGQPNICVKCKTKTFDNSKQCLKCSGNEFIRLASMNVDKRFVEFSLCEDAYREFITKAENVRKSAGQWLTKS